MSTTDDFGDLDAAAADYVRRRDAAGPAAARLRDEFAQRTLPLARRLARRYRGRGEPTDDLEQVARLGLVKTIDRYDPQRGSFTAYAVLTITGEIKRYFRDHGWSTHVPRAMQELSRAVGHARAALTAQLRRVPTRTELAAHLGIDEDRVRAAEESAAAYVPMSLSLPSRDDGTAVIADRLGGPDHDLALVDDNTTLEWLLWHLPERERRILALRFYGNKSQAEIAAEIAVSQMQVSRLLSRALAWLRQAMLSDAVPVWHGGDQPDHRLIVARSVAGGVLHARVSGEIDRDNAGHLRQELLAAVGACGRAGRLVVDLAGVPLLDAAGIGTFVAVHDAARVRRVTVRLTGLQPFVRAVVAVTGLRELLDG